MSEAVALKPRVQPIRVGLLEWQARVFTSESRFRVKVCGRRSGKTYEDALELVRAATRKRNQNCWYVAPTYKMSKEIMWATLKSVVPRQYLRRKPLETDLVMDFINGSMITLKGAEDPDSLRGPGLDWLSLDEFAYIDPRAWYEVMRPMIADRKGRANFSTTPAGLNWAYDLWLKAREGKKGWEGWQITTLESGNVDPEEISQARDEMSARTFKQEFEASFEAVGNRVYDGFTEANVRDDIVDQPSQELLVGMDFNINPMSLVLGVKAGRQLHVFDALEIDTSNTLEVAQELRRRYPNRTIIVCPDPSGRARKTSAGGATDFTILESYGMVIDAPNAAPLVVDRINSVNGLICNAKGERNVFLHPRCMKTLGRALNGLQYKEDTRIPDPKSQLIHITDAFGYLVWQRFNYISPEWRQTRVRF